MPKQKRKQRSAQPAKQAKSAEPDTNNDLLVDASSDLIDKDDAACSSDQPLSSFIRWCQAKGVRFSPKIRFTTCNVVHGRGMVAKEPIDEFEVLFTIPRTALLSTSTSKIGQLLASKSGPDAEDDNDDGANAWTELLLALMAEEGAGADSAFAGYLNTLPRRDVLTHPLFWPSADRKQLEGLRVFDQIAEDMDVMQDQYETVVKPFVAAHAQEFANADTSLVNFHRWAAVVMAYSFSDDVDGRTCMVPVADVLNHVTGKNNARLFYSKDRLEMCSLGKISPGEEIFNTYGSLDNQQLLQKHGFVEPTRTPYEDIRLELSALATALEVEADTLEMKLEYLEQAGFTSGGVLVLPSLPSPPLLTLELRDALRTLSVLVASQQQIERLIEGEYTAEAVDDDMDDDNDDDDASEADVNVLMQARRHPDPVLSKLPVAAVAKLKTHLRTKQSSAEDRLTNVSVPSVRRLWQDQVELLVQWQEHIQAYKNRICEL